MRQYIYRYHNPDKFEYLHPKMKELLEETYGVMVYQEDVIKVAHHFAGLDMGEADVLRRAMSGKYQEEKSSLKISGRNFFKLCKRTDILMKSPKKYGDRSKALEAIHFQKPILPVSQWKVTRVCF